MKQERWTEQVENAINNVKSSNPNLKSLLTRILGFSNIPRKEAKFVNFLKNSVRIRDENLCREAWKAISEEAAKFAPPSAAQGNAAQRNGQASNGTSAAHQNKTNGCAKNGTTEASTNGHAAAGDEQVCLFQNASTKFLNFRMATARSTVKHAPSSGKRP